MARDGLEVPSVGRRTDIELQTFFFFLSFLLSFLPLSVSFLAEKIPEPRPGFECVTGTKTSEVTFSSQNVTFQVQCDAARFRFFFFGASKNVTIFLELGTNVTISSHRHIIFLGSAWNKPGFENLARS